MFNFFTTSKPKISEDGEKNDGNSSRNQNPQPAGQEKQLYSFDITDSGYSYFSRIAELEDVTTKLWLAIPKALKLILHKDDNYDWEGSFTNVLDLWKKLVKEVLADETLFPLENNRDGDDKSKKQLEQAVTGVVDKWQKISSLKDKTELEKVKTILYSLQSMKITQPDDATASMEQKSKDVLGNNFKKVYDCLEHIKKEATLVTDDELTKYEQNAQNAQKARDRQKKIAEEAAEQATVSGQNDGNPLNTKENRERSSRNQDSQAVDNKRGNPSSGTLAQRPQNPLPQRPQRKMAIELQEIKRSPGPSL